MSRIHTPAMSRMQNFARNPVMIALVAGLALASCAKEERGRTVPASSASVPVLQRRARPRTSRSMSATASSSTPTPRRSAPTLPRRSTVRLSGSLATRTTRSPSKAMPTSAAPREYNLALGARRAAAAKDYLASRGVPAQRMKTISYGKERPVAVCDDISCWSQNRRAVTVLGGAGM